MLQPKRTKFKKFRKGNIKGFEYKTNKLYFGNLGLQALQPGRITNRQIEAVRRTITNFIKRQGKVWIRIFPDIPVTEKPLEVRMGKGKGPVSYWVAFVKPGRILYEITGPNEKLLRAALEQAALKLPIATKVVGL